MLEPNDKDKKEKLVVWLPPIGENDQAVWGPIMKEYGEANNVDVELEIIPWENYSEKYEWDNFKDVSKTWT